MGVGAKPFAIITGGSSGIGLACAVELLQAGCVVALLARNASRLEQARDELCAANCAAEVVVRSVDVSDHAGLTQTINDLISEFGAPQWLVCSSGIARPGLFLDQDIADHVEHMQTNYLGLVATVKAAIGSMVHAATGHVVLISSGASFVGIYGYSAYAPSKFAVRALGEILRLELADTGVSVSVACPPDTDTPQLISEQRTKPRATALITASGGLLSARTVAKQIIRNAQLRRPFIGPGWQMHSLYLLHSLIRPLLHLRQKYLIRCA